MTRHRPDEDEEQEEEEAGREHHVRVLDGANASDENDSGEEDGERLCQDGPPTFLRNPSHYS
jgi:hypothetical protein